MGQVSFGEAHKIVGSHSSLGSWNVDAAPLMEWSDGDVWTLDISIPAGEAVEFKVGIDCGLSYLSLISIAEAVILTGMPVIETVVDSMLINDALRAVCQSV